MTTSHAHALTPHATALHLVAAALLTRWLRHGEIALWSLLRRAAWRFGCRGRALDFGRPPEHELREIMNAILYVDRTGVHWRYLPHDFPPWETVYGYFVKWQKEGIFDQLNGLLREQVSPYGATSSTSVRQVACEAS